MESIDVKVLGGTFQIEDLKPSEGQSPEDLKAIIVAAPPESWIIVLHDSFSEEEVDTLAMIDEEFEMQIVAVGRFRGE